MGACYQSSSRILVWNFEFFGSKDHHLSHHHSHVCSFLDTFWYICFVIAFCRLQYIPNFNCSKFYWLYSVPLVSIFSSYLPHLSFSLPFLITIIFSVPFSLVLVRILPFMLRHHCVHFYQDGVFVLVFCSRFSPIFIVFVVVLY